MKEDKNKHKKKTGIILVIIIILIGCIYIFAAIAANKIYPKATRITHQLDNTFTWLDFNITTTTYHILSVEEVKKLWSDSVISQNAIEENDKVLIVEMKVNYIGKESSATFPIVKITGQSAAWTNASDFNLITSINKNLTCKKGETYTFYTTIPIKEIMFPKSDWKNISNRKYELIFSTYPNIVSVELN